MSRKRRRIEKEQKRSRFATAKAWKKSVAYLKGPKKKAPRKEQAVETPAKTKEPTSIGSATELFRGPRRPIYPRGPSISVDLHPRPKPTTTPRVPPSREAPPRPEQPLPARRRVGDLPPEEKAELLRWHFPESFGRMSTEGIMHEVSHGRADYHIRTLQEYLDRGVISLFRQPKPAPRETPSRPEQPRSARMDVSDLPIEKQAELLKEHHLAYKNKPLSEIIEEIEKGSAGGSLAYIRGLLGAGMIKLD